MDEMTRPGLSNLRAAYRTWSIAREMQRLLEEAMRLRAHRADAFETPSAEQLKRLRGGPPMPQGD